MFFYKQNNLNDLSVGGKREYGKGTKKITSLDIEVA